MSIYIINNTNEAVGIPWGAGARRLSPGETIPTTPKHLGKTLYNMSNHLSMDRLLSSGRISIHSGGAFTGRTPKPEPSLQSKLNPTTTQSLGIPLDSNGFPTAVRNKVNLPSQSSDVALILCHHGQSEIRIKAAKDALSWTLQSNPKPFIILVEASQEGEPLHFDKEDIDTYITRTITGKNKDIWLKEALWNIGAVEAVKGGYKKLCFLDLDSAFIDQDWTVRVSEALEEYDFVSPHKYSYLSGQEEGITRRPFATRGYLHSKGYSGGHPGIAVAMTTDTYRDIFDNHLYLGPNGGGDTIMWMFLTGSQEEHRRRAYMYFEHTDNTARGGAHSLKIGYADNIIAHYPHGPSVQRNYLPRAMLGTTCFPVKGHVFEYDDEGMPSFKNEKAGNIFRKTLPYAFRGETLSFREMRDLYDKHAGEEYGKIDEDNPLVITCLYRPSSEYTPRHVYWLKEQFDKYCKAPFRFVCQTNEDLPGIETIPLITTFEQTPYEWGMIEHFRDIWDGASVLACSLDTVVVRDFTPHQCPEGEVYMARAYGHTNEYKPTTWYDGVIFFKGNFQPTVDAYLRDYEAGGHRKPDYAYINFSECLCGCLREMGVWPRSIEAHLCVRLFDGDVKPVEEAVIIGFPGNVKPWDIKPKPDWITIGSTDRGRFLYGLTKGKDYDK